MKKTTRKKTQVEKKQKNLKRKAEQVKKRKKAKKRKEIKRGISQRRKKTHRGTPLIQTPSKRLEIIMIKLFCKYKLVSRYV